MEVPTSHIDCAAPLPWLIGNRPNMDLVEYSGKGAFTQGNLYRVQACFTHKVQFAWIFWAFHTMIKHFLGPVTVGKGVLGLGLWQLPGLNTHTTPWSVSPQVCCCSWQLTISSLPRFLSRKLMWRFCPSRTTCGGVARFGRLPALLASVWLHRTNVWQTVTAQQPLPTTPVKKCGSNLRNRLPLVGTQVYWPIWGHQYD